MIRMKFIFALSALLSLPAVLQAEEELPRVLVLGDSVHRGIALSAANELRGRVSISYPKGNYAGDTGTALANFDALLDTGKEEIKWDLIYFNFGFADLHYKDRKSKDIRVMSKHAGGVRVSSPQLYEQNLRELVKRLKATGVKLIWASTTPITGMDNIFDLDSEAEYNDIAAKIMTEQEIPVIDVHAFVLENVERNPGHSPFDFKRVPLHPPMVKAILTELSLPATE
jgi:hypothetical protein